jgi:hypothetical protein
MVQRTRREKGKKTVEKGPHLFPKHCKGKENGFNFPGKKSVCLLFTKGIKGLQRLRRNGKGGPEAVDVVVPFWTLVFYFPSLSLPFHTQGNGAQISRHLLQVGPTYRFHADSLSVIKPIERDPVFQGPQFSISSNSWIVKTILIFF